MHERRREITEITEDLTNLHNGSFLTDNCLTLVMIFQSSFIEILQKFSMFKN